jgi:crotonobetainyl-CoA:carnitine CoA-transferase CaiB-like acyl-CoA transferase
MSDGALAGLKVLEYGEFVSAPYCGKLMADAGADVIKVEKQGAGDKSREYGPFPQDIPHPEKSGLFLYLNTNKRSVTLNLKTAAGRKVFKELVQWADVLIENTPLSDLPKLGLDYETLHDINPRLVVTSITYFGLTGPYADFRGCDLINTHTSVEAFLNPAYEVYDPERNPPLKLPGHSGDFLSGLMASICTMSGVFAQKMTGEGQHIDLSQQEAVAAIICHEVGDYFDAGITYLRDRKYRWWDSPKYPCSDGFIMMNIPPQFWEGVIKMMDSPAWAQNPAYKTPIGLNEHMKEIQPQLIAWFKQHTCADVVKRAMAQRLDISIVQSAKQLAENEMFEARKFMVEPVHPVAGKMRFPGAPCKFSATPAPTPRAAPLLGEHNAAVYGGMLGYSPEKLEKLHQAGTI